MVISNIYIYMGQLKNEDSKIVLMEKNSISNKYLNIFGFFVDRCLL